MSNETKERIFELLSGNITIWKSSEAEEFSDLLNLHGVKAGGFTEVIFIFKNENISNHWLSCTVEELKNPNLPKYKVNDLNTSVESELMKHPFFADGDDIKVI